MRRTTSCMMWIMITLLPSPPLALSCKEPAEVQKTKMLHKAYRMQIPFIENQGQLGSDKVSFYAKTFGGTLYIEKDGTLTYSFSSEDKGTVIIKEMVTGKKITAKGLEPSPTKVNYFKGKDQKKWKTNIPSYESVSLGEIYKGIDLRLRAYGKNVEKLFTVSPGENPEKIEIKLQGANDLKVNEKGELEVITKLGSITFTKPKAYQEIDGKKVEVNVSYNILNSSLQHSNTPALQQVSQNSQPITQGTGVRGQGTVAQNLYVFNPVSSIQYPASHVSLPPSLHHSTTPVLPELSTTRSQQLLSYGFRVGDYNEAYSLLIDPLLSSTFIGGSEGEMGRSISLDESGNVYVIGHTGSTDYPTTPGVYDRTFIKSIYDDCDVFVSKLDRDLSTLLASTFIGGSHNDYGTFIALDGSGNVYVAGYTNHTGLDTYPTTPGAYNETHNGQVDVFVSKLDNSLSTLLASTFIGGGGPDYSYSLALDGSENMYVTGYTNSSDYPTTPGGYDRTFNGNTDVFISKLDNSLSTLLASTFIGGSGDDVCHALALDGSGNAYVTGSTEPSGYPTTPWAYDRSYNGGDRDVFISKLNSNLSSLLASTYIGGGEREVAFYLALDGKGNVYVTGQAGSDYPTTSGAYERNYNDSYDLFLSKFDSSLSFLKASTYIGGSRLDSNQSLTFDGCGNIYIAGDTTSSDFPTTPDVYSETHSGGSYDLFISKFDSSLSFLFKSTYLGGDGSEQGESLVLDRSGNVYVTGSTGSSDYPTTPGAYNRTYNDIFISELDSFLSAGTGQQSARASFLSDPSGAFFVFDADGDGVLHAGCTQLLLCAGQIGEVDIWLTGWDSTTEGGDVESVDYYFNWDEQWLTVEEVTCNNPDWDNWSSTYQGTGSGSYSLHVDDTAGLPGPDIKLHTIKFTVNEIDAPFDDAVEAIDGVTDPTATVTDGSIVINGICGGDEFACEAEDHCERMDECPDTAVPDPGSPERYYWEPQDDSTLCKGDIINIFHIKKGFYTATEEFDPELCDSTCFNQCYDNCAHAELHDCYLECVRGCACDVCANWGDEEVCYEYQSRIACSIVCYNQCYYSYDQETQTAEYNNHCGFSISETINILADSDGDCETGSEVDSFTLEGVGTPSVSRPLPLDAGIYEICTENDTLIDMIEVEECTGPQCKIFIPTNLFTVNEEVSVNLEDIEVETDSSFDGSYTLSLFQWNFDHSATSPAPASLSVPATVPVLKGSGTFDLSATSPQPVEGENHWINITIRAVKDGGPTCEAALDYDIRMKGDVNNNGVIEVADIQREINIILEVPPPATSYESWAGDFDDSESIDISDVQLTINRFLEP